MGAAFGRRGWVLGVLLAIVLGLVSSSRLLAAPERGEAWYLMAEAAKAQGHWGAAKGYYLKIAEAFPGTAEAERARKWLARLAIDRLPERAYLSAIRAYGAYLSEFPDDAYSVTCKLLTGHNYLWLSQPADALPWYDRILREDAESPLTEEALYYRGYCKAVTGDPVGAIEDLRETAASATRAALRVGALEMIANCQERLGDWEGARATLEQVLSDSSPEFVACHGSACYGMGHSYYAQGDYEGAREWLTRAATQYAGTYAAADAQELLGRIADLERGIVRGAPLPPVSAPGPEVEKPVYTARVLLGEERSAYIERVWDGSVVVPVFIEITDQYGRRPPVTATAHCGMGRFAPSGERSVEVAGEEELMWDLSGGWTPLARPIGLEVMLGGKFIGRAELLLRAPTSAEERLVPGPSVPADGVSRITAVTQVFDQFGEPLAGYPVEFHYRLPGMHPDQKVYVTTDCDGVARYALPPAPTTGLGIVQIVTRGTASRCFVMRYTAAEAEGEAAGRALSARVLLGEEGRPEVERVWEGEIRLPVVIEIVDGQGEPASETVEVFADLGRLTGQVGDRLRVHARGRRQVTWVLKGFARPPVFPVGVYVIRDHECIGQGEVLLRAPIRIECSVSPGASVAADGVSRITATAKVFDQFGEPLAGVEVSFEYALPGRDREKVCVASGPEGVAQCELPAVKLPGKGEIQVWAHGANCERTLLDFTAPEEESDGG